MQNWYVLQDASSMKLVSFCTDDTTDITKPPNGFMFVGPYPSLLAAQQAVAPIVQPASVGTLSTLSQKDNTQWTMADIAAWLKSKG